MAEEGQSQELPEVSEKTLAEPAAAEPRTSAAEAPGHLGFVMEVPLRLSVQIGGAQLLVRDVLQLGKGSVVELDRANGEPADVLVNGRLVARGEVTVVEERMAIRIVEVVPGDQLTGKLR